MKCFFIYTSQLTFQHWMKPASVSLAKLDQVKAKVYNLGLTDQQSLKARPGSGRVTSARGQPGIGSTLQLDTQPPLSNVSSQRHAW